MRLLAEEFFLQLSTKITTQISCCVVICVGGGHTRQEDVAVPPTQSRMSPSTQRLLKTPTQIAAYLVIFRVQGVVVFTVG